MQERCDLWVNLDTPELGDVAVGTGESPAAYLRFESSGQTFGLPDLLPSSEGSVGAIPMLWSDALGRGIETRSFTGDVKLCYATDSPDGWRCSIVTIVGIGPDGAEQPIRGAKAAYEWLRAWEHRAEHSASTARPLGERMNRTPVPRPRTHSKARAVTYERAFRDPDGSITMCESCHRTRRPGTDEWELVAAWETAPPDGVRRARCELCTSLEWLPVSPPKTARS